MIDCPGLAAARGNLCIGSDAGAPDRGFDMFRHRAQAMHDTRRHFRDAAAQADAAFAAIGQGAARAESPDLSRQARRTVPPGGPPLSRQPATRSSAKQAA